jgi:hypothetical protein
MKPMFTVTTQKPNNNSVNGKIHILCNKTKPRKSCQQSRACWWSFYDHKGIVHQEFLCSNQIANQYHCQEIVQHLRKQAHCQYVEQWPNQTCWFIITMSQQTLILSVQPFLATKNMSVALPLPYSPDMDPCNFFLFVWLISQLQGCPF